MNFWPNGLLLVPRPRADGIVSKSRPQFCASYLEKFLSPAEILCGLQKVLKIILWIPLSLVPLPWPQCSRPAPGSCVDFAGVEMLFGKFFAQVDYLCSPKKKIKNVGGECDRKNMENISIAKNYYWASGGRSI